MTLPFAAGELLAGFGVLALPRAGALAAAAYDPGIGFLVGAPVDAITGFLAAGAVDVVAGFFAAGATGVLALFLGVGAGRAFWPVLGAPKGFEAWDLTCLVAAADGAGCIDFGKTFLEAFVTYVPGAEASGSRFRP